VTGRESVLDDVSARQAAAVVRLLRSELASKLVGVYLHGSAVLGGLRPGSDLDILAVVSRRTTIAERRHLVTGVMRLSGRQARPPARPVELTIVRQRAVRPWRYPPRSELLYGEWLRDDYEAGFTPGSERSPDLALLISLVLHGDQPLVGPPPAQVLDPVPTADLVRAGIAGIPGLRADLETDTTNVLLTLARIWVTTATGAIVPKDTAADLASDVLPDADRAVLAHARNVYLGAAADDWSDQLAVAAGSAEHLIAAIERASAVGG
jgi:streptomycin 3"-adenylyltransferase